MSYIAIIDYQLSNLFSVQNALNFLGAKSIITSDPEIVKNANAAILPGVGAFGDAMKNLDKTGLTPAIKSLANSGRPFMGVCLGLQLLFTQSEEFGHHQGLDLIAGDVLRFPSLNEKKELIKIPQIGWNRLQPAEQSWQNTPLGDLKQGDFMYFVHSYYVKPLHESVILSKTNYMGFNYCSSIKKDNIFATQFHPEKSSKKGLEIYYYWLSTI